MLRLAVNICYPAKGNRLPCLLNRNAQCVHPDSEACSFISNVRAYVSLQVANKVCHPQDLTGLKRVVFVISEPISPNLNRPYC